MYFSLSSYVFRLDQRETAVSDSAPAAGVKLTVPGESLNDLMNPNMVNNVFVELLKINKPDLSTPSVSSMHYNEIHILTQAPLHVAIR